jgi:2-dehydro-3-deoxygluconokinase
MKVVTFGEIMGRLATPGFLRLRQALPGPLDVTFAGAEANVAVSLSLLGADAVFVTALPNNVLAEACIATLDGLGVDTRHIVHSDEGRFGLYFLETGANQRPSQVIYDRDGSSISRTPPERYPWETIFEDARWFHVTGITPAISQVAADATLTAVKAARRAGISVSCDLNFRKKLWRWDPSQSAKQLAGETMRQVLLHVDMVIANEEDCESVLGIQAADTDVEAGKLQIDRYPDVARQVAQQFPEIAKVAITLRESISASHNNWGGMLYDASEDETHFAPLDANGAYCPYPIRNIVDRVGGGDSFAAALIFASLTDEFQEPSLAIRFAVAASCLAHSVTGDFNFATRNEVEALMHGSVAGRVVR